MALRTLIVAVAGAVTVVVISGISFCYCGIWVQLIEDEKRAMAIIVFSLPATFLCYCRRCWWCCFSRLIFNCHYMLQWY